MRFYFQDQDQARRARIARTATATVAWTTTLAVVPVLICSGPLSRLLLGERQEAARLRGGRPVGVHNLEMAYAQLRVDERARAYFLASASTGVDRGVHGRAGGVRRRGCPRAAARQLRRLRAGGAGFVVGAALDHQPARAPARPARDVALRPADGSRGSERLRAAGRRSLLPAARPGQGRTRPVRRRTAVRHGGVRGRTRLPVRLAAAGLLDRERRRGVAAVLVGHDLLRAGDRRGGGRAGTGRPLDRAAAGRPQVLSRLHGAALAGARLGAVRPLPRVHCDHGPRARHAAQSAGRAGRSGDQHWPAVLAGAPRWPGAGNRGGRNRAVWRLRA